MRIFLIFVFVLPIALFAQHQLILNNGWALNFGEKDIEKIAFPFSAQEGYSSLQLGPFTLLSDGTALYVYREDSTGFQLIKKDETINGNISSAQSAVFLKTSDTTATLFTNNSGGKEKKIYYSLLEYRDDEIVIIKKNKLLFLNTTEHLATVMKEDNTVLVASFYSLSGALQLAKMKDGELIDKQLIAIDYPNGAPFRSPIGILKFNSIGSRIASTFLNQSFVIKALLDIENNQLVDPLFNTSIQSPYGIEFFPNQNKCVVSTWKNGTKNGIYFWGDNVSELYAANANFGSINLTNYQSFLCPKIGTTKLIRVGFASSDLEVDSIDVGGEHVFFSNIAEMPAQNYGEQFPYRIECDDEIVLNDTIVCGDTEFSLPKFQIEGGFIWESSTLQNDEFINVQQHTVSVQNLACSYKSSFTSTIFKKNKLAVDVVKEGTGVVVTLEAGEGLVEVNGKPYKGPFRTEVNNVYYVKVTYPECVIKERLEIII